MRLGVGFWDWLFGDNRGEICRDYARKQFDMIKDRHRDECGKVAGDDVVGPDMTVRIREIYMQGGEVRYRSAVALWQMANAVYPKHVTKEHYPKLMPCLWRLPLPNDQTTRQ